ncbi:MAG: TraB/GumN family protein [Lachnospiraceae bacterium]|nr:TraB/GumN family protein [Lachnospiraceae bacterium]
MKKAISLLLAAVLITVCLNGCGTGLPLKTSESAVTTAAAETTKTADVPDSTASPESSAVIPTESEAPTEEPTVPPETEPEPLTAAQAYEKALSGLPADYHREMRLTICRSMDRERLTTSDEWIMDVKGSGTEAMTAVIRWTRTIENERQKKSVKQYELCYSKGKAVLISDGTYYLSRQSREEFLNLVPPLALLTAEKYGSLTWTDETRGSIVFSEAEDTEWEWLGMNCSDIEEAGGLAILDEEGNLSGFEYEAAYALEGISFEASAEMGLYALTEDPVLPAIGNQKMTTLEDLRTVPLLDLAGTFAERDSVSSVYIGLTYAYIIGGLLFKQEWCGTDTDDYGPMFYDRASQMLYGAQEQKHEFELRHFGGETHYEENGREKTVTTSAKRLSDAFQVYFDRNRILPQDLQTASLLEEDDCWLIEFTLGSEAAERFREQIETELVGDVYYLSEKGVRYKPEECSGYLSLDKGSGMPIHLKIDLDGTHLYEGEEYELQYQGEWTFQTDDPDVWYLITDALRPSEAPEEAVTPLFYQVTGPNGHSLWLLGTIHVGDERTAHLPQEIYDALLSSDALAVEIDITDMENRLDEDDELLNAYQTSTVYTDGTTVYDHLEEEVADKLELALKKYGGDIIANVLFYNAATLGTLIEQETLEQGRMLSYNRGVDQQLIKLAKDSGIEVWDVEDYAEHIALLGGFSEELQALILEETIDMGRYASNLGTKELFDAWCRGNEEELSGELEEENQEDEELTPEEQALVDEYNEGMMRKRNAEMVEKVKEYLDGDKTVFFAVGLAHLLDQEDGLLKCLREAGYTVERVSYASGN